MLFRPKFLASAALLSISANFALADSHANMTSETIVASVDGSNITLGQIVMLRSQLPEQYQQLPDDVIFNGLVEQLVNQQLLGNSLDVEPKRISIAISNEVRSMRASEVVNTFTSAPVSDTDLQAAFDTQFSDIEAEAEYNASHILVETEEEAVEIKAMIDDGADFAETAIEKSTGPSGPAGGDLGWFGPGMMVPAFEEAVLLLEANAVSAPVQTQFGWHIVKLNEVRVTPRPTLDDLRAELTASIQQQGLDALIMTLTESANITLPEEGQFDFSLIQNLQLLED
ncbi:MAG: peptidyl-prolyl cis-trans isomerase C [Octadecabacter sp.]|jgi:peptidyl-prolyl cis-trans isomerase C